MDSREQSLVQIFDALPEQFDFYHLGRVELHPDLRCPPDQNNSSVVFRIYGDLSVWIVLFFDKDLDFSTYAELGNVLASKIITQLNTLSGIDLMVSPPIELERS